MGDLNISFIAAELGKSLEEASERVIQELNQAVEDLASAAYANISAHIQASQASQQNKQNYLKSLKFEKLGNNSYVIFLEGDWPNKLEEGFGAYDMKETLLKSKKIVGVGPRSGQPWVQTNAEGKKFASVPFEHRPYAAKTGELAADIKTLFAKNRQGKEQKITKTFTDEFGQPIAGKVATASGKGIPPNLQNLTKYQHISEKGRVSSLYMTFRRISEDSSGWQHPGFAGYGYFEKVEQEIERELENILKTLL